MKDINRTALAAAVAGGYVLGRTKKGRMAFAVGTYLAGRRAGLDPQKMMAQGMKTLKDAPQLAGLGDQVRGQLMDAGRQALAATADRKMAGLAEALHKRTLRLEDRDEGDDEDQGETDQGETEAADEADEAEEEEQEPEKEPEKKREGARDELRSRGAAAGKAAQKATAGTATAKKATGKKTTTAGKAAAKKAPSGTDASSRSGTRRR